MEYRVCAHHRLNQFQDLLLAADADFSARASHPGRGWLLSDAAPCMLTRSGLRLWAVCLGDFRCRLWGCWLCLYLYGSRGLWLLCSSIWKPPIAQSAGVAPPSRASERATPYDSGSTVHPAICAALFLLQYSLLDTALVLSLQVRKGKSSSASPCRVLEHACTGMSADSEEFGHDVCYWS